MKLRDLGKLEYEDASFETVLEMVGKTKSADVKKVDAREYYSIGIEDLREDVVQPSLPRDLALMNAMRKGNGCYIVPLVVE